MRGLEIRNVNATAEEKGPYGNRIVVFAELLCPRCGTSTEVSGLSSPGGWQIAYVCRRCRGMILVQLAGMNQYHNIADYHPKRQLTADPSVPGEMASDYLEAQRCFLAGAWRACSVMARRFVHSAMADKGAKGGNLYDQIKDLETKRVLTPSLAEASQQLRVLGKYGAHPFDVSETGLEQMHMEDAQAALDFCETLIEYVYVLEAKLKASRAATETRGKETQ